MVKFTQAIAVLVSLAACYTLVEGNGIKNRNKIQNKVRARTNRIRGGRHANKLHGGYNKAFRRDSAHNVRKDGWDEREDILGFGSMYNAVSSMIQSGASHFSGFFSTMSSHVQELATALASDGVAGLLDQYDSTGMAACAASALPQAQALMDGIDPGELAALSQAVVGCISTKLQDNEDVSPCVQNLSRSSQEIVEEYWAGEQEYPVEALVCGAEQISKSCDAIPDFDISDLKDRVPEFVASRIPGFDSLPDCNDVAVPPTTTGATEAPPAEPATGGLEAPPSS